MQKFLLATRTMADRLEMEMTQIVGFPGDHRVGAEIAGL